MISQIPKWQIIFISSQQDMKEIKLVAYAFNPENIYEAMKVIKPDFEIAEIRIKRVTNFDPSGLAGAYQGSQSTKCIDPKYN